MLLQTVRITETFSEKMSAGFLACLQFVVSSGIYLTMLQKREGKKEEWREGGRNLELEAPANTQNPRPRQKGPPADGGNNPQEMVWADQLGQVDGSFRPEISVLLRRPTHVSQAPRSSKSGL